MNEKKVQNALEQIGLKEYWFKYPFREGAFYACGVKRILVPTIPRPSDAVIKFVEDTFCEQLNFVRLQYRLKIYADPHDLTSWTWDDILARCVQLRPALHKKEDKNV